MPRDSGASVGRKSLNAGLISLIWSMPYNTLGPSRQVSRWRLHSEKKMSDSTIYASHFVMVHLPEDLPLIRSFTNHSPGCTILEALFSWQKLQQCGLESDGKRAVP